METDLKPSISGLFVGSFNINAAQLTEEDARIWLQDALTHQPDVIALGFQECGTMPDVNYPNPRNFKREYSISWRRQPSPSPAGGSKEPAEDFSEKLNGLAQTTSLHAVVCSVLTDAYKMVVDVAIGEPPTDKIMIAGKKVQWYGAIRMLVFFKTAFDPRPEVSTLIIPTGNKHTAEKDFDGYDAGASPDKGAVAAFFPEYGLCLVNCHLEGTNKYGLCESAFDAKRVAQLAKIHATLAEKFPRGGNGGGYEGARVVTLGDLNFRVQLRAAAEDKARGGRDFAETRAAALTEDRAALLELFRRHDRLHLLLGRRRPRPGTGRLAEGGPPALLARSWDALWAEMEAPRQWEEAAAVGGGGAAAGAAAAAAPLLRPTFTKKPGKPAPRDFEDKRTPSWTDRIFWEGRREELVRFRVLPEITVSDHDPVSALFELDAGFDKAEAAAAAGPRGKGLMGLVLVLCRCFHLAVLGAAAIGVAGALLFPSSFSYFLF